MKVKSVNNKIAEVICQSAMKIAQKTVEVEGYIPICTIIIHQPDVPEKLKRNRNTKEVK